MILLSAGEPARRPRLEDVAADVGVSPATVSLVLRGIPGPSAATRERVLEAAARLGYRPDRAASVFASRRSRSIGVMMDIGNTFHAQLVEDVHEAAERHGYDLVLSTVTRSRDETPGGRDAAGLAVRGAGPARPGGPGRPAGRAGPAAPGGGRRPAGPVRSASTWSGPPTTRASAQAVDYLAGLGPPPHQLRRRRTRRDRRPPAPRIPARHAPAPGLGDQIRVLGGGTPRSPVPGRRRPCCGSEPRPTAVLTFNDRSRHGPDRRARPRGHRHPRRRLRRRLRRQPDRRGSRTST